MLIEGFEIPSYVTYCRKEAGLSSQADYNPTDYPIIGQENVWLSRLKLACAEDMRPLTREIWVKKIATVAERYGITHDLDAAVAYVERLRTKEAGIETLSDYAKARDWLFKNAEHIDPDTAATLSGHLQSVSVKIGYIPLLTEKYRLDELSGHDPDTPEVLEFVESHIHKLASGSVYTAEQFRCLPVSAVEEYLPDLLKTASLGMNVMEPHRFGKVAETLCESDADVLDTLMQIHGETPIHSEYGAPVEINDEILAVL
jgi:hypothetical protein